MWPPGRSVGCDAALYRWGVSRCVSLPLWAAADGQQRMGSCVLRMGELPTNQMFRPVMHGLGLAVTPHFLAARCSVFRFRCTDRSEIGRAHV